MADDDSKIFPQKLMEILSDPANQEAVRWLPHGRSFIIRNRALFIEKVMPRYFSRTAKYSSFTRKLNRWNFARVSCGPELGAYYHEFFLRDKPYLAAQMFCRNARSLAAMSDPSSQNGDTPASLPSRVQPLQPQHTPHQDQRPHHKDAAQTVTLLTNSLGIRRELDLLRELQALEKQLQTNRLLVERALMMLPPQRSPIQELQMHLQNQKFQQERLNQLRQLMRTNVVRQQQPPTQPSNKRASAA